jgi:hypothetical protein
MMHEHGKIWLQCRARVELRTQFFGLSHDPYETMTTGGRPILTCKDVLRPFVIYAREKFPRIQTIILILKKWL